jgi:hypothetical protein
MVKQVFTEGTLDPPQQDQVKRPQCRQLASLGTLQTKAWLTGLLQGSQNPTTLHKASRGCCPPLRWGPQPPTAHPLLVQV